MPFIFVSGILERILADFPVSRHVFVKVHDRVVALLNAASTSFSLFDLHLVVAGCRSRLDISCGMLDHS